MAKNKKGDHVIMGDKSDLLCTHCGARYKLPFPMTTGMFAAIAAQYSKEHKHCEKVWDWPVADPVLDYNSGAIYKNISWWLQNGEHGISALTMLSTISRIDYMKGSKMSHPHDPGDFRRCHLLLNAIPQFRRPNEFDKIRDISPVWKNLFHNWDTLTEMYLTAVREGRNSAPEMSDMMKELGC